MGGVIPITNKRLPWLDTFRNFLATPSLEGKQTLQAIRNLNFAA
jgi:hypothetical protein